MYNDTDDSLDGCIWLTGEQLDEIFARMESELRIKWKQFTAILAKVVVVVEGKRKVTKFQQKTPYGHGGPIENQVPLEI